MRLARIQATLGPACSDLDTLRKMVEAGMDGCRLNMSHCSSGQARELAGMVRRISKEKGRPIALGADLRGPKLRIGDVEGSGVVLAQGSHVELTPEDRVSVPGLLSVNYPYLSEDVRPGDPILLNDGALRLRVEATVRDRVVCRVEKGGLLTSRKGVNLPGVPLRVPSLTEKDVKDIALAVELGVDFLYVSFARSRGHIMDVRKALQRLGSSIPLVAKIERQEGVDALSEIVDAADGICVARGDLGVETPLGAVPFIQREAAGLCHAKGRFAMMGGQVLASMVSSPTPLRAEVADLATIVRDGNDAIVLSDETAAGEYPVEAVRVAAQVMERTEQSAGQNGTTWGHQAGQGHSIGSVVVVTSSGEAVKRLSTTRSAAPIVAAVDRADLANWLSTWWGVVPVLLDNLSDPAEAARLALKRAAEVEPSLAGIRPLVLCELS
ncbi:MAG TPA: pyruvate kinase [Chloroflexota bacterium]|nr:pyruvate kinase [Chloroflexota bacterium]